MLSGKGFFSLFYIYIYTSFIKSPITKGNSPTRVMAIKSDDKEGHWKWLQISERVLNQFTVYDAYIHHNSSVRHHLP